MPFKAPSPFDVCPEEILLIILHFVEPKRSLLDCRLLSKRNRDCIDSSFSLQYAIKLDTWGYQDIGQVSKSHGNPPVAEKLEGLDNHIRRWAALDWEQHHIAVPRFCHQVLSQGYLYMLKFSRRAVDYIQLPSCTMRSTAKFGTLPHTFGFEIASFAVDPSQDLLIALEGVAIEPETQCVDVHCRSLLEDAPHTQGKRARIQVRVVDELFTITSCQILGAVIGVLWCEFDYGQPLCFALSQWITGETLLVVPELDGRYALLNETTILHKSLDSDTFESRVVDQYNPNGRVVSRFSYPPQDCGLLALYASSSLPTLRASPSLAPPSRSIDFPSFYPTPSREHIGLISSAQGPHQTSHAFFNVFAPQDTFLRAPEEYEDPNETIPLSVWSLLPGCCEVFTDTFGAYLSYRVHGSRFVSLTDTHIQVWDLNRTRAAWAHSRAENNIEDGIIGLTTLDLHPPNCPLYSRPLTDIGLSPQSVICEAMIDNERIVLRVQEGKMVRPDQPISIVVLAL